MSPDRSRLLLLVVGTVVLLALIAGAVAGALREPLQLDPATPEGTVQAYITAVLDEDHLLAAGYLAEDIRDDCGRQLSSAYVPESLTVTLGEVEETPSGASVTVEMRQSVGDFIGPGEYTFEERFELEPGEAGWVVSAPPWPVYFCEELS